MLSLAVLGHGLVMLLQLLALVGAGAALVLLVLLTLRRRWLELARPLTLLLQLSVLFWLVSVAQRSLVAGTLIAPHQQLRWVGLLAVVPVGIALVQTLATLTPAGPVKNVRGTVVSFGIESLILLLALAAAPWWEDPDTGVPLAGRSSLALAFLLTALIGLPLYAIIASTRELRRIGQDSTPLTFKVAFESFPGALAFGGISGVPALVNERMARILAAHRLSSSTPVQRIWQHLEADAASIGAQDEGRPTSCIPARLQTAARAPELAGPVVHGAQGKSDHILVRLHDEVWEVTRTVKPSAPRDMRLQLWGQDVTPEYALAGELVEENLRLAESAAALERATREASALVEQQDVVGLRLRLHDVLAQRLTFVKLFVDEGVGGFERTQALSQMLTSLADDLWAEPDMGARARLERLRARNSLLGTHLEVRGQLPADEEAAGVFVDILAQASTNAVLHAGARRVEVDLVAAPAGWTMNVSNALEQVAPPVVERTGLAGMRMRLAAVGGRLEVLAGRRFTLRAFIPTRPPLPAA